MLTLLLFVSHIFFILFFLPVLFPAINTSLYLSLALPSPHAYVLVLLSLQLVTRQHSISSLFPLNTLFSQSLASISRVHPSLCFVASLCIYIYIFFFFFFFEFLFRLACPRLLCSMTDCSLLNSALNPTQSKPSIEFCFWDCISVCRAAAEPRATTRTSSESTGKISFG